MEAAAADMAAAMIRHGFDLVYGGASIGVMGSIANAVLQQGGKVFGVMPASLADREIAHTGLTELKVTTSMHERKTEMAAMSDAFLALPGGLGTLEELFEMWTWGQLGLHAKPIGLLNVDGFYDQLLAFVNTATHTGFIKPAHRDMLIVDTNPDNLLESFKAYVPQNIDKLKA